MQINLAEHDLIFINLVQNGGTMMCESSWEWRRQHNAIWHMIYILCKKNSDTILYQRASWELRKLFVYVVNVGWVAREIRKKQPKGVQAGKERI